jgi:hypothetical protein
MRGWVRRLQAQAVPGLAVMAAAITLYLAPTKDTEATLLVAAARCGLPAGLAGRAGRWAGSGPVVAAGRADGVWHAARSRVIHRPTHSRWYCVSLLSALVFGVFYRGFAGLRIGRRYVWLVFLFAAPAVVHLLYMASTSRSGPCTSRWSTSSM